MIQTLIIGLSAKKQAGKTTLCDSFIKAMPKGMVSTYSFADALKEFCVNVLGLRPEQVYGTDYEKNTFTEYKWDTMPLYARWVSAGRVFHFKDLPGATSRYAEEIAADIKNDEDLARALQEKLSDYWPDLKIGSITARELMQLVGTDICRNMFDMNIWVKSLFRKIEQNKPKIAVVPDVRFPGELGPIIDRNGLVVRLTRSLFIDAHSSETALDDFNWQECQNRALRVPPDGIDGTRKFVFDWLKKMTQDDPLIEGEIKDAIGSL